MEVLRAISPEMVEDPAETWQKNTKATLKVLEGGQKEKEINLEQACALFVKSLYRRGQNSSTIRRTYYYLKIFMEWCQASGISGIQIQKAEMRAFFSHCKKDRGLGAVSLRMYYWKVKALFSFLQREGYVTEHPMDIFALPILNGQKVKQVLSLEESSRLFETIIDAFNALPKHYQGRRLIVMRDLVMLELMLATGLRVSEIAGLSVSDLDMEQGILNVTGKGSDLYVKRNRVAFIDNPVLMEDLRFYLKLRGGEKEDILFTSKLKRALSPAAIDVMVKKWGQQAGITRTLHCHLFRHTFCTQLVLQGADMYSVQKLMGHHDVETTLRFYLHLTPEELKADWKNHNPLSGR